MSNGNRRQPTPRPQQRPSKAQRQAMEARSAATSAVGESAPRFDPVVDLDVVEEAPLAVVASEPPARGALPGRRRPRPAAPTYGISREMEYRFIEEDMRRLLVIAAILLAVMVLLLFVVDR